MANEPEPPESWRVYEKDSTPDPEPPAPGSFAPPSAPSSPPSVPYGGDQSDGGPIMIRTTSGGPRLVIIMVAVAVLGVVVAGAIWVFSRAGGVDPKTPDDFREMVEALEEDTGTTDVFSVGLYDGYAILYVPVDSSKRSIAYRWDGGGLEEWTKSTSSDQRFDLAEIDPDVIGGMCDPVLELADGATEETCSIQVRSPDSFGGAYWFTASASDEYGSYYSVNYDKNGVEVDRTIPE